MDSFHQVPTNAKQISDMLYRQNLAEIDDESSKGRMVASPTLSEKHGLAAKT